MEFRAVHPWALLPHKAVVDHEAARERAKVYREHFRYVRAERQPEFCAPWVLGQELGWRVASPIDVTLSPLPQIEVEPGDAPETAVRAAAMSELWRRERTALTVQRPPWLHLYQFRHNNQWENMFIPNGQTTVEWRMGWVVDGFGTGAVLVLPSEARPELGVQVGVLTAAVLRRMSGAGFSVPINPRQQVTLRRGDEIARIVYLHPDSLAKRATEAP